jgi:hypothetical protein
VYCTIRQYLQQLCAKLKNVAIGPLPTLNDFEQRRVKIAQRFFADIVGNPVGGLRDTARYRGERVTVAAERNRVADCVLEVRTFEERGDCLRNGVLTALIELIRRANFIKNSA